uniref:Uncharacterized protein n=1 Tax=Eucampia antarctica TaxID=49252 RepID=A0A7S2SAN4_9STRA|mmetsp:Transcript_5547/g.5179  ORF Transcript_5547/g.5179 Transcript_5547/m.5179 type:complete len:116 (+) Transcript_5547:119-466(+)
MVLGKQGMRLEAWKFAVYLIVPIGASIAFNNPLVQKVCADYFQFLKYPANPNTNLKEEFEELLKKRELEREQRKQYTDQVRKLQESAQKSRKGRESQELSSSSSSTSRKKWFGLF